MRLPCARIPFHWTRLLLCGMISLTLKSFWLMEAVLQRRVQYIKTELKPLTVPADEGVWLHNGEGLVSVESAPEPHQGKAHGVGGTARFNMALLVAGKLFTQ